MKLKAIGARGAFVPAAEVTESYASRELARARHGYRKLISDFRVFVPLAPAERSYSVLNLRIYS